MLSDGECHTSKDLRGKLSTLYRSLFQQGDGGQALRDMNE
jgi:hypothetical protein